MNSETASPAPDHVRIRFEPLKPKRRSKAEEKREGQVEEEPQAHEPVLVDARAELKRSRARMARSGRPQVEWRRITSPVQLSEVLPARTPPLRRVVDKVKSARPESANRQGIWSLLRCWALAFR
jgi:hypothetical protein